MQSGWVEMAKERDGDREKVEKSGEKVNTNTQALVLVPDIILIVWRIFPSTFFYPHAALSSLTIHYLINYSKSSDIFAYFPQRDRCFKFYSKCKWDEIQSKDK